MRSGPVLIGFDGSDEAAHAIREAATLMPGRQALVVVVYKAGLGFELVEDLPIHTPGLPPAPLDVRTALEIDRRLAESAQRLAARGREIAQTSGFSARGLAVADDVDTPIAQTLVTVATERDGQAIVLGARGHTRAGEVFIGSTTRDVIRRAACPVVVVRHARGQ